MSCSRAGEQLSAVEDRTVRHPLITKPPLLHNLITAPRFTKPEGNKGDDFLSFGLADML